MNLGRGALVFAASMLVTSAAWATPVVTPGGKPGAAASWTANGTTVTLTLASGYDAAEVAKAIGAGVKGATAKAEGGKVVVTGLAQAALLSALEKVDVKGGAAEGDDVDAMLAAMQKPGGGEGEDGSGSSVRASKASDFSEVMGTKTNEAITAKVVEVKHGQFPMVAVTLKITAMPKGLTLPGVKSGAKITVVPRVKSKNGVVDPTDEASKLNLGAWYTEAGDMVLVQLEGKEPNKEGVWVAAGFDRKVK